jgi:hypothetical protein
MLITFLAPAQAQIPNGSFENWTTVGSYSNPDGWDNFNSLTAPNSVFTCEKGTTSAPHGASYIMLTTKVAGTSTVPGLAVSGKYDLATKKPKSGFAYTGRPARLTGKWQYMANGTDTGRIAVYLTKWNSVTGQRDLIGSVEYDLPGMVMSWASFSIPLSYQSAATPDSAVIGLVSSNKTATAGSYLYVDSLNFAGTTLGVSASLNTRYSATLFPNPAKGNLSIDFGTAVTDEVRLWVIDMYGRVVTEATWNSGKRVYSINLNAAAPGLYCVKLKVGGDIQTQRLVVQ